MIRCKNIALLGLIATAFFTACEKPEKLYPQPKTSVGIQSQIFAMGENYANQLWFDFATQKTETNAFGLWHMAFSCDPNQPRVSVNGGISASFAVARFAGSSFGKITTDSIKKVQWHFDNPNGNADSSAFPSAFVKNGAQWEVNDYTYVIDLGDKIKDSTRYVQLKFNDCKPGQSYDFEYKNLEPNGFLRKQNIALNVDKNFVYYQFLAHRIVDNEPFNNELWDILFTTYKESVPDANGVPYPYVIRGVLINPKKVSVAQLNNIPFDAVNLTTAQSVSFSKKQDEIGYDWKQYDQTAERYTMVPNRVYLIKTTDAIIKMKFVDFYNDQGVKGYPKMAWEILK
jgi:hypothetical protein